MVVWEQAGWSETVCLVHLPQGFPLVRNRMFPNISRARAANFEYFRIFTHIRSLVSWVSAWFAPSSFDLLS